MPKKITSFPIALATVACALVGCGDSSSDTIPGTSPAIAAAVCDGDAGCESDMRALSHKLDSADDADGDGIIDREELDAAFDRLDQEEQEAQEAEESAAASSSAAAARSSEAAAEKREAEASSRRAAEREQADREQDEREAAQREQAAREQAAAEQAAAEQAAAEQAAAEQAAAEQAAQQQQQQQAGPQMEYATMGPYGSLNTCEQTRGMWPVQSSPCYIGGDGNAYFDGMRQAAR